jgi:hypothetical protein
VRAYVAYLIIHSIPACVFAGPPVVDGNRLTYLDEFCDPYYVGLEMPKLITPQWVGETGVEAVVTLGIDDMRDPDKYEAFLRPILNRLKQIDGRAPVSIMTCSIDPQHPQLQKWLEEGLSLETHTTDHPCPLLQGGDFEKAKSTYDRCVDELSAVPNSRPVAFRFPCMDSQNTPSPRAYAEILSRKTHAGNSLQISTSVCNLPTADDPALPRELVVDVDGRARFGKYLPFKSFVNKVENYPYPFVVGRLMWEFPCCVPDDWLGFNLQGANNPKTVDDVKAAIDAAVVKRGMVNIIFHPHGWVRSDQMSELVDHVDKKYGGRLKFLNFRECLERLNAHLLAGQPLRAANGQDNGVRLLDVDRDGYLDVVIGNSELRRTRVWLPTENKWHEGDFPEAIVEVGDDGARDDATVRFGVLRPDGMASLFVADDEGPLVWHFDGRGWTRDLAMEHGLDERMFSPLDAAPGADRGVRLRDIDNDGRCEILVSSPRVNVVYSWDEREETWRMAKGGLPPDVTIVDKAGRDAGLRFVDLDRDGYDDIVLSNDARFAVYRFDPSSKSWTTAVRAGSRGDAGAVPMIVRGGMNNGAWFAEGRMWVQNEDTDRLPDGVARVSFEALLGKTEEALAEPVAP